MFPTQVSSLCFCIHSVVKAQNNELTLMRCIFITLPGGGSAKEEEIPLLQEGWLW